MQTKTFRIATKFERTAPREPSKPTEYTDIEGVTIGNWGIVKRCEHGDCYRIYHIIKGLPLSFYYFDFENALIALQKAVDMFGEYHNGEPTPDDLNLQSRWEFETFDLMPDDDDDDDDDDF